MRNPSRAALRAVAFLALLASTLLTLGGCRNNAQNGALIGAAAGAAGGYMIGNEADKR